MNDGKVAANISTRNRFAVLNDSTAIPQIDGFYLMWDTEEENSGEEEGELRRREEGSKGGSSTS